MEECRLRVFKYCIMRSFMICTAHQILFRWSNQEERGGQVMWHEWGTGELYTVFWWRVQKNENHLENQGVDGGIVLTWTFKNCNGLNIDWIDLTQALVNVVMC